MEFGEKILKLRKDRGLTQEELAQALYVSRNAVSKWESGKGYPGIDSLKEIATFFSVSIDYLLSAEKIISIAEKENSLNLKNMCDLLICVSDSLYIALIILPVYSNRSGEHIYAVNLFVYLEKISFNHMVYRLIFCTLMAVGAAKIILSFIKNEKVQKKLTIISMLLGCSAVIFLAMTREVYAICVSFLLFLTKGMLLFNYLNANNKKI